MKEKTWKTKKKLAGRHRQNNAGKEIGRYVERQARMEN